MKALRFILLISSLSAAIATVLGRDMLVYRNDGGFNMLDIDNGVTVARGQSGVQGRLCKPVRRAGGDDTARDA